MNNITTFEPTLKAEEVGDKASSLGRLVSFVLKVPNEFVIRKKVFKKYTKTNRLTIVFETKLNEALIELGTDDFIVRCSAILFFVCLLSNGLK